MYHGAEGLDSKTPLRNLVTVGLEPNDIPFMGLTTHDKDDLAVFIPLYPIPFSYSSTKKFNAWDIVRETQSICCL